MKEGKHGNSARRAANASYAARLPDDTEPKPLYWIVEEDDLAKYGDMDGMTRDRLQEVLDAYPLQSGYRIIVGREVKLKTTVVLDE